MERRISGKVGAYATPTGLIPKYDDLADLFKKELQASYSKEDYEFQFMTCVPELLDKLNISKKFFQKETSAVPKEIFGMIDTLKDLLLETQKTLGDNISPFKFKNYQVPVPLTLPF